jgi:hypothetical protein
MLLEKHIFANATTKKKKKKKMKKRARHKVQCIKEAKITIPKCY